MKAMGMRERLLQVARELLLGDVYRRLEQLEQRVGQLGAEVLPGGRFRRSKPLAQRVDELEEAAGRSP